MGSARTAVQAVPAWWVTELSEEERQRILLTCNQPEYASLPPGQIVPALADQKLFIGSESSFYRVLHQASQNHLQHFFVLHFCLILLLFPQSHQ